jgi:hypothetical protein
MNAYTLLNDLRDAIDGIEALAERDKLPPMGAWFWQEFTATVKRAEALRNDGNIRRLLYSSRVGQRVRPPSAVAQRRSIGCERPSSAACPRGTTTNPGRRSHTP